MQHGYRSSAEAELLQLMLVNSQVVSCVVERDLIPVFQEWAELAADVAAAWQQHEGSGSIDVGTFLDLLPKAMADRVSKMMLEEESDEAQAVQEQLMWDCIEKVQHVQRKSERVLLQREIREAEQRGDEAGVRRRLQTLHELGRL